MSESGSPDRVLLLTPHGRDADVACRILEEAGMDCHICADVNDMLEEISRGAGALLLATEALPPKAARELTDLLDRQPSWSELPVLIFALPGPDKVIPAFPKQERHFTILDRPVGVKALISATRSALRWRKRQYEVRNLMEALENRIHERDKFLAILGHELRNPLGAILLASQMVNDEDGRLDGEHAQLIERQSRHLTRLVDDLLDLSRVTAGKIVLQRRPVDLRDVIRQTLETLKETIRSRELTFRVNDGESAVVSGDPVRLEQIVGNLLTNAIKYTPAGGSVEISCSVVDAGVELRVKDTGVGIAPERLDSIFGLFMQAENAIGRAQGGMGIGLSLVRNLVELHGGSVRAMSDGVGAGSEFIVVFPALGRDSLPATEPSETSTQRELNRIARKIVVVEDNADVRTLLQLKLRRLGHDVESVGDGERGIERIESLLPDLAVVDIGLPGMSGYEVAQEVRRRVGDDVFLVALSGFGQPEDKQRAIEAGFNEHMTKPADVSDIEQLLERVPRRESER